MSQQQNSELSANKLYKSAFDNGYTNIAFADWIEEKGKQHVQYQEEGGELTFVEWELKNQEKQAKTPMAKKVIVSLLLVGALGLAIYFINKKKQN